MEAKRTLILKRLHGIISQKVEVFMSWPKFSRVFHSSPGTPVQLFHLFIHHHPLSCIPRSELLTALGHTIAWEVIRWLPTAAAKVWPFGSCGQGGIGARFPQVLHFSPDNSHCSCSTTGHYIILVWCNRISVRWINFINLPNPSGRSRPWSLLCH
jgi:hypothetical protein